VIDAAIELARAKELLYRRTDEIFSRAQILYEPRFVRLGAVVNNSYRARRGLRSIYMWSATFNAHPNDFLISFLQAKGVRSVLLSSGKKVDKDKMRAFTVAARAAGIRVEILFSDNDWLKPDHYATAVARITSLTAARQFVNMAVTRRAEPQRPDRQHLGLQSLGGKAVHLESKQEHQDVAPSSVRLRTGIGAIHLDIEPHSVAAYKGHPRKIQSTYLGLLHYLRSHLPQAMRISVSVPAHWQPADYKRIARLVGDVFIMDYGSAEPDRILRRLKAARAAIPDDKLTLALRASDFRSERQMEQVLDIIMQRTGIRRFAIQATGGYLQLSNQQTGTFPPRLMHMSRSIR